MKALCKVWLIKDASYNTSTLQGTREVPNINKIPFSSYNKVTQVIRFPINL